MRIEEWRPVVGYEDLYEVSSYGVVRNTKTKQVKRSADNGRGYAQIQLSKHGAVKSFYVHRLIAIHFLANPHGLPMVNHKDGNKRNNSIDNLEWCDAKHNGTHASENNLLAFGERCGSSKLNSEAVRDIRSRRAKGETGKSIARDYNVDPSTVYLIARRVTWRNHE